MIWSAEEILEWVNSHGGLDGGGLEELQRTVDEGRFSTDREKAASRFLARARQGAEEFRREEASKGELRRRIALENQLWSDAEREEQQRREQVAGQRREELHFIERSVLAAESQADTAREALKTSRVAAGLSLFALIVAFIALIAQLKGMQQ